MSDKTAENVQMVPKAPTPRRLVSRDSRDWGVWNAGPLDPASACTDIAQNLTRNERRIMLALLAAIDPDGRQVMVSRRDLKTSANVMQGLYFSGWVNGAGSNDARGQGNTPDSSWWWLTTRGEEIARAAIARAALMRRHG